MPRAGQTSQSGSRATQLQVLNISGVNTQFYTEYQRTLLSSKFPFSVQTLQKQCISHILDVKFAISKTLSIACGLLHNQNSEFGRKFGTHIEDSLLDGIHENLSF